MPRKKNFELSLINHEDTVVEVQVECWSSTENASGLGTCCKYYK